MLGIPAFEVFAKIILDKSGFDKGLDEASQNASSFAGKLKSGLATAAKVGAAALGAASTALGFMVKNSVENFAEYEQLVGGVETLFKNSSDTVMKYAENAYKTAGMSANEYMETVTSFSASLLQSLGGDTDKAASVADQAITDMSDNANKMGTSMEMIQNAYNGFAKANFTMLDNLKLGYGGTKEEMQRLIADANAVKEANGEMADLSIDSFADITEAIHIIQTEMGITGTTAAEASSTIQGSVASAKSAWENLVTGIGNENANLGDLIGQFVDSVVVAGENIIPRVQQILVGIGEAVQQLAPVISEQLPVIIETVLPSLLEAGTSLLTGLIEGIVAAAPTLVDAAVSTLTTLATYIIENLPMLVDSAGQIVTTLVTSIGEALPQILDAGAQMLDQLVSGIETGLPDMISRLPQVIDDFLNFITENLPSILDKGVEILNRLVNGIIGAIPDLLAALPEIITSFVNFISNNLPKIISSGIDILMNLIDGIIKSIPDLVKALPKIITAIVDGIGSLMSSIKDIGKNIVQGIWDGISNMASWIKDKVSGFFGGIVDGVKWLLGIHSPSKVFAGIGENMAAGLGDGWDDAYGKIKKDIVGGMNFGTANVDFAASGVGRMSGGIGAAVQRAVSSAGGQLADIVINLTANLDGKTIYEGSYRYARNRERAYGGT